MNAGIANTKTKAKPATVEKSDVNKRIKTLLMQVGADLYEREQILAVALLGAISGQNTFLYGPPGTAKSLISRRLAHAFKKPKYFEYLMNRFSTPEEVFGPVSIKLLKEDRYIRKIEGYLPTADFAFLDEIWKSSPAILNTLLTLINEHVFKNGDEKVEVPLKALIAASNEVPAENQGLDALYDRFVLRLLVPPIKEEHNFQILLNSKPSSEKPVVEDAIKIDYQELREWQQQISQVLLNSDTLLIIKHIRTTLSQRYEELGVYVSDRRWQRAAILLKASAFCNGRKKTNHSDCILLKHCLWTSPENQEEVSKIVMRAIEDCGFTSEFKLSALDEEKESLDKEIENELFYSKDIYKTVIFNNTKVYFKAEVTFKDNSYYDEGEKTTFYIDSSKFKSRGKFHPVDNNGNELRQYTVDFDKQGACKLSFRRGYEGVNFIPKVLFYKGSKKSNVNRRLVQSLSEAVSNLREKLEGILEATEQNIEKYKLQLESPFVSEQETDRAVGGILTQITDMKLRVKDCERLEALCE